MMIRKTGDERYDILHFDKEGTCYTGIKPFWTLSGDGIIKLADVILNEITTGGFLKKALRKSNGRLAVLHSAEIDLKDDFAKKTILDKYKQRRLTVLQKIFGTTPLEIEFIEEFKVVIKTEAGDKRFIFSFIYDEKALPNISKIDNAPKSQEIVKVKSLHPMNYLLKTISYFFVKPHFVEINDKGFIFSSFSSIDEAEKIKKEWTRKMYVLHTPNLCLNGYYSTDENIINELSTTLRKFQSFMDEKFKDSKLNLYRIPETATNAELDEIYDILNVDYFKIVELKDNKTGKYGVLFDYDFWGDWIFDILYFDDSFEITEFNTREDAYEMGITATYYNWTSKHGENPVFCKRDYREITNNIPEIENLIHSENGLILNKDDSICIGMASIDNLKKLENILIIKPFHVIEL